jgi:hypothetical protein
LGSSVRIFCRVPPTLFTFQIQNEILPEELLPNTEPEFEKFFLTLAGKKIQLVFLDFCGVGFCKRTQKILKTIETIVLRLIHLGELPMFAHMQSPALQGGYLKEKKSADSFARLVRQPHYRVARIIRRAPFP